MIIKLGSKYGSKYIASVIQDEITLCDEPVEIPYDANVLNWLSTRGEAYEIVNAYELMANIVEDKMIVDIFKHKNELRENEWFVDVQDYAGILLDGFVCDNEDEANKTVIEMKQKYPKHLVSE